MPSKKSLFVCSIALAGIMTACSVAAPSANLNLEQATQLVLDQVIHPNKLDHIVILFSLEEPLAEGDILEAFRPFESDEDLNRTEIDEETWFFWLEDNPGAHFAHENRFVFVNRANGDIRVVEDNWWPMLDGTGLWVKESDYWNRDNWIYSNIINSDPGAKTNNSPTRYISAQSLFQEGEGYFLSGHGNGSAVVINGWEEGQSGKDNFSINSLGMIGVLGDDDKGGLDTDYLGPPIEGGPVPSGESNLDDLRAWFKGKAQSMKPGETLFVYVTGHGWMTKGGTGYIGDISENTMKGWLEDFDNGVNIIFVGQACHSGSFLDSMSDVADVAVSSSNVGDPSYMDIDPNWHLFGWVYDPNPDDEGSEFSSGLIEGFVGLFSSPESMEEVETRTENSGESFWVAATGLAYVHAVENDVSYLSGFSTPDLVHGDKSWASSTPTPAPANVTAVPTNPSATDETDKSGEILDHGSLYNWEFYSYQQPQNCSTGAPISDPQADIESVSVELHSDKMAFWVNMAEMATHEDYSFAIVPNIYSQGEVYGFTYELHNSQLTTGAVNLNNGELLADQDEGIDISRLDEFNQFKFELPFSIFPGDVDQIIIQTFHASSADGPVSCGIEGPFVLNGN